MGALGELGIPVQIVGIEYGGHVAQAVPGDGGDLRCRAPGDGEALA
jgi:hypothetical protein